MSSLIYPDNVLILAPLSGFTDLPYRRAARRGGCYYAFTEMVDAASLAFASMRTINTILPRGEEEAFLGVQLVGSNHEWLKRSCEVLNEYDYSLLDFNLGCPVPKVTKKHAGAALGRDLDSALACFEILKKYSRFPLTAKLRIIAYDNPQPTVELAKGLVSIGAQALTIHGRPLERFYGGPVDFSVIKVVAEAVPSVPVIANGGVRNLETYNEIRSKTGCSRVMLAQGAMGNPWLFRELAVGGKTPDNEEWKAVIIEHIMGMVELYGEQPALRQSRKILHDYLKKRHIPAKFRAQASTVEVLDDVKKLLDEALKA